MKSAIAIIVVLSATGFLIAAGAPTLISFDAQKYGEGILASLKKFTQKTEEMSVAYMDRAKDLVVQEDIEARGLLAYASKLIASVGTDRQLAMLSVLRGLKGKDLSNELESVIESQYAADSLVDDKIDKLIKLAGILASRSIYKDVETLIVDMKSHQVFLRNTKNAALEGQKQACKGNTCSETTSPTFQARQEPIKR